ncbi:unnamed protein product [Adineta ricciae]|uniref:Uncharacterized protein n=1 Tax=Adineta ricciae TaxID=249248 RepID=A0A814MM40_ADIRI|nr:unnamed protein product [Adineta ricciae]CAF1528689.1 unnamed protein product [Adineta ricciae]
MLIEEDSTLLQHRLRSAKSSSISNLLHEMIDDIDADVGKLNEAMEISPTTCCSLNEMEKLKLLKNDIIHRAIFTNCKKIGNLDTAIQNAQSRFSLKNRFMYSTLEGQKIVLDAIETRQLHIIKHAIYIKQYRLAPQSKSNDNPQHQQISLNYLQK